MRTIRVEPRGFPCELGECPPGLFLYGEGRYLGMATEYYLDNHRRMAYIVASGETYCGEGLVQPCAIVDEEVDE